MRGFISLTIIAIIAVSTVVLGGAGFGIYKYQEVQKENAEMTVKLDQQKDKVVELINEELELTKNEELSVEAYIDRQNTEKQVTQKPILDAEPTETPTKVLPSVPAKTPPLDVQPPSQITQPTGTLCNGTYWDACPTGQKLTCPTSGDAYCDVPQVITEPLPQIDNDQFCKDTYGNRSIWDANTTNCACESGYLFDAGSNSCISTYLFCKNSYGNNAIWDESRYGCACKDGYEPSPNNQSCVFIKTEQQVQSSNSTINNSACQTARDNLLKLQQDYSGSVAGVLSRGTTAVATGNAQRLTDQYNTKLPVYQLAAQAACQFPASNTECQTALQKLVSIGEPFQFGATSWLGIISYGTEIQFACQ